MPDRTRTAIVAVFFANVLPLGLAGCASTRLDRLVADNAALRARVDKLEHRLDAVDPFIEFLRPIKAQMDAQQQAQADSEPDPDAVFAIDLGSSPSDGPAAAYVTIVIGVDFACPYCRHVSVVIDELVQEHPGELRVVYKSFLVHPHARPAHLGGCAAHRQGKYLEFERAWWAQVFDTYIESHDMALMGEDSVLKVAAGLKLDLTRFKTDMTSESCAAEVQADQAELTKFGVNGTPALFLNGKSLPGAVPKEQLETLFDHALETAKASGVAAKDYYQREILAKGEKQFKARSH